MAQSNSTRRAAPSSRVDAMKDTLASGTQSTKDNLLSGAKTARSGIGTAAQKAKGPALAGGAALAGLAGGLVIAGRNNRRRVVGVPIPVSRRPLVKITVPRRTRARALSKGLIKAAGEVGSAGRQFEELAREVRRAREQVEAQRRRSPIEVLLDGLTHRPRA